MICAERARGPSAGSALWLIGWLMNIYSDSILRNLRKPGETGYKIPRGKGFYFHPAITHQERLVVYMEWQNVAVNGVENHEKNMRS